MTQLTQSLDPSTMTTTEAVQLANQYLTPSQRIQIMEQVLAKRGGSTQIRLAAYLALIDAYQDVNRQADAQEMVQRMVAECTDFNLTE